MRISFQHPMLNGNRTTVVVDTFRSPLEALDIAILRGSGKRQPSTSPLLPTNPRPDWYGIATADELRRACALGIDDQLAQSVSRVLTSLRTDETMRPVRRRWDVAGGSLSVPKYLSGDPMPFRHRVKGRARSRTIEVVILPTIDCNVSKEESETMGRCIGQVLGILTGMGYAVGISTLSLTRYMFSDDSKIYIRGADIRIKSPSDLFNPRKISFALSRVLARALFIALVMQDPAYPDSYSRRVLPPTYDDMIYQLIDDLHPGPKAVFDANDLISRLQAGWEEDRCIEYLISSIVNYT